jgi:hypothetical protein
MEHETLEPAKSDERAQRAKNLIIILMVILIAAPFILYFAFGTHVAPTQ